MIVYKIFRDPEWRELVAAGDTAGAPIDIADGFVHLSSGAQVAETAARHFAGETGLMLLAIGSDGMDDLKWEPSRGGALFPHLHGRLRLRDVLWAMPLPFEDGAHRFPEGVN